jgi:hypothetical protein
VGERARERARIPALERGKVHHGQLRGGEHVGAGGRAERVVGDAQRAGHARQQPVHGEAAGDGEARGREPAGEPHERGLDLALGALGLLAAPEELRVRMARRAAAVEREALARQQHVAAKGIAPRQRRNAGRGAGHVERARDERRCARRVGHEPDARTRLRERERRRRAGEPGADHRHAHGRISSASPSIPKLTCRWISIAATCAPPSTGATARQR